MTQSTPPVLSSADHQHFIEKGYVVVRRAVEPDAIAAAVAALEGKSYEGTVGAADYKPVRTDAVRALSSPRFAGALSELMGEQHPLAPGSAGTDMPRPHQPTLPRATFAPHVDDDYPTALPNHWAIGSFLFLTPVRAGGGAFVCWPGSPRALRVAAAKRLSGFFLLACDAGMLGEPLEFLAEPGDLLLFHHLMAHCGTHNSTDPRTRHALLSRHHPSRPVVPGDKPFERMSTLEKANSARYLRERLGDPIATSAPIAPAEGFGKGMRPMGTEVICQAAFIADGLPHLLYVAGADPSEIRHAVADDWTTWRAVPPLPVKTGLARVRSLQLVCPKGDDPVLIASGIASDGSCRAAILRSHDWSRVTHLGDLPGLAHASGFHTTDYGNAARVRGVFILGVPADDRARVLPRLGEKWEALDAWKPQAPALPEPVDGSVIDFVVAPTLGESEFAAIVEVMPPRGSYTVMHFTQGKDCLRFEAPLRPLPGPIRPASQLRVLARGRRFWLVTYVRPDRDETRLFWGAIDWALPEPRLEEITTREALREAMLRTGLD